jgi:hypothetical protein
VKLRSFISTSVVVSLLCGVDSCSQAPSDARIGVVVPNASEEAFGPVSDFLDHRCGTLDCHGQSGRNLRVWGCEGLRLMSTDASICSRKDGGRPTTTDEHRATYRSLVGLEPTVMSEVVANRGRDPELLTFIRKARGTESHKGGVLFTAGDDQDVCVTSWLSGQTNLTACSNAFSTPAFPSIPGQ